MERFIILPNLPQTKVSLVAIPKFQANIKKACLEQKISVLEIKPSSNLPYAVKHHTDMLVHHLGRNHMISLCDVQENAQKLRQHHFDVVLSSHAPDNVYPKDVLLNVCRVGQYAICNPKYVDFKIMTYLKENNITIINVKQGYAKCSVCIVNETSIITADKGIYNACKRYGLDVLLICAGGIYLDGYDYGFLGGASGLIAKNKLAFTGNIYLHKDADNILKFLEKKKMDFLCLSKEGLIDIGGIIPLKEKMIEVE